MTKEVSQTELYNESCRALGESIVLQRIMGNYITELEQTLEVLAPVPTQEYNGNHRQSNDNAGT